MKYISVTSPGTDMAKPIFNYFNKYLISLGEPITNNSWDALKLMKHLDKILEEKPEDYKLYIDSGGFQIIVGYVESDRIYSYINVYHTLLKKYKDKIETIFGLDVYSDSFMKTFKTLPPIYRESEHSLGKIIAKPSRNVPIFPDTYIKEDMLDFYDANKYSMLKSIELIKEFPEIANKQIFILQSSNIITFNIWKDLFDELEVYKYYKRWSIGGLVGLKKSTNARFSHAVPATLWLLTQQRLHNFEIDQIHWLGQSSRLSFLSMALFEKIYGINMTSDSSQLVRFAPLEAKLPYIIKQDDDFELISSKSEVVKMFNNHSIKDAKCFIKVTSASNIVEMKSPQQLKIIENNLKDGKVFYFDQIIYDQILNSKEEMYFQLTTEQYFKLTGKLDNQTFIEFQSQNLSADLEFGNFIINKIMKLVKYKINDEEVSFEDFKSSSDQKKFTISTGIDAIDTVEDIKCLHPIMNRGRTSLELFNNIKYFKQFAPIIKEKDIQKANHIMDTIVLNYNKYFKSK